MKNGIVFLLLATSLLACGGKRSSSDSAATGGIRVEQMRFEFSRAVMTPMAIDEVVNPKSYPIWIQGKYSGSLRLYTGIWKQEYWMSWRDAARPESQSHWQVSGPIQLGMVRVSDVLAEGRFENARILELTDGSFRLQVPAGGRVRLEWLMTVAPGGRQCSVPPPVTAVHEWLHHEPGLQKPMRNSFPLSHGSEGARVLGAFERSLSVAMSEDDIVSAREFFRETQLDRADAGVGNLDFNWAQSPGMENCVIQ